MDAISAAVDSRASTFEDREQDGERLLVKAPPGREVYRQGSQQRLRSLSQGLQKRVVVMKSKWQTPLMKQKLTGNHYQIPMESQRSMFPCLF